MKKCLVVLLTAVMALSTYAKDIKELVVTTNPPMSCQNCENKIKKGDVRFVKGVKDIKTNLQEQRVTVTYDADKTTPEKIEKAFEKTGYKVKVISPAKADGKTGATKQNDETTSCTGNCCDGEKK